ncbi:MFS transporter [Pseudooceanicola algae]|uniref:Putative transport protein HsrA n=1 Tax=Pseudooceanicola algae TaxID=1537215 RepID=A0A418SIU6_9RHOB|nr:MFS transporter [Pseudooceanicola algae]QPM91218.1 putative transport protein HsrA [Pseudooceanicola algae]
MPMLTFTALRYPTFRVPVLGGSAFRVAINATPFLLPLLFQLAFGWSAFHAGIMLTAIFAGNIVMKPWTSPILRRFGFRAVLLWGTVLNALAILALAFVGPGMPYSVLITLLFASGLVRSLQFTALATLAFADVPQAEMSDANVLFTTVGQLGRGLGVAIGAICWRMGEALFPNDAAAGFHFAFVVLGVLSLLALIDIRKLPRDAGEVVRQGRRAR